jgi:hypothetical protein
VWIETAEDGQYLNAKLVERFSVDRLETDTGLRVINAYMPVGQGDPGFEGTLSVPS